eukprot:4223651-Prymnesium_polylepis.3
MAPVFSQLSCSCASCERRGARAARESSKWRARKCRETMVCCGRSSVVGDGVLRAMMYGL